MRPSSAGDKVERTEPSKATTAQKRYGFLDHYRGWAVLVMIETHAMGAWLMDSVRTNRWYEILKTLHGFVAPSFLFIAGVSFAIVVQKKFDRLHTWTPDFWRQFRKIGWIWILGYLFHFPPIQFHGWLPTIWWPGLTGFYRVDILQTIAASLMILLFLCPICRTRKQFGIAVLGLAAAALWITPILWRADFSGLHPAFSNYLNGQRNFLFPLFPWCIFLWGGTITGCYFFAASARGEDGKAITRILACAVILFAAGYFARSSQIIPYHSFWTDSPQWVLMRFGIVLGILFLFWFLETLRVKGLPFILLLGTESLFVYIVHLMLIWEFTGPHSRFPLLGYRAYGFRMTYLMYAILLAAVYFLTLLWKRLDSWWRKRSVPPAANPARLNT